MKLYHATTDAGRAGIEQEGFAESKVRDSAGCSWFPPRRDAFYEPEATWFVIVEIPTDVARRYWDEASADPDTRADFRLYKVPFEVINSYRPFTFEPIG